jgi:hypothetical protein
VRAIGLSALPDGTAWVAWTRRDSSGATGYARRTRAGNRGAVGPVQALGAVAYGFPHVALGASDSVLAAWNARGPGAAANVGLAAAQGTGATLGAPVPFDAGGFSHTSPIPAFLRSTPLVAFTRQIPSPSGAPSQVAVADATTGDATGLGPAASIGTPAVAHIGAGLLVAWAAQGGGVAVSVAP